MTHSVSDLRFLSAATLRAWMRGGNSSFAVVDVRDSDYIGGHIKGCWHYPSGDFESKLPELKKRLVENGISDVVFHCALSQVRGPSATLRFMRSLEPNLDSLRVWVLQGGFTKWQEEYGEDEEVTEGFQRDLWR